MLHIPLQSVEEFIIPAKTYQFHVGGLERTYYFVGVPRLLEYYGVGGDLEVSAQFTPVRVYHVFA
jgi:hypothetical protein